MAANWISTLQLFFILHYWFERDETYLNLFRNEAVCQNTLYEGE